MLDIGCGNGRMGLWAAARGARRVVGLEPEAEGSSSGMQEAFDAAARRVGLADRVELVTKPLQEYETAERFDVVLLAAPVNHLDEDACVRLHEEEAARETYRERFRLIARVAAPGAHLIVTDCDRRNVFARIGARNPLCPTIEWEKHQSPFLWSKLLGDVGFEAPRVRWAALNTLRGPGQLLLGHRFGSYMLTSAFLLRMRRSAQPA